MNKSNGRCEKPLHWKLKAMIEINKSEPKWMEGLFCLCIGKVSSVGYQFSSTGFQNQ